MKRNKFLLWCLAAMLLAIAGVGADKAAAASFSAPPGKALVYLLQGETQQFANVSVFVDRRSLAALKANSYVAFSADPGVHLISAAGAGTSSFRLSVDAGKTYYVSQRINAGGIPVFGLLGEREAQPLLARYVPARSEVIATGGTSAPPSPAPPTGEPLSFTLSAKSGVFKLSQTEQNWFDIAATVDDSASGLLGVEFGFRTADGWSVSGELIQYKNSWTQVNGDAGKLSTTAFLVNGKKYFNQGGVVHPYLGIGVGAATTTFSGDITGTPGGVIYQILGGVEFQFQHFGMLLELKSLSVDAEGNRAGGGTVSVDTGGTGMFAGVSAHF